MALYVPHAMIDYNQTYISKINIPKHAFISELQSHNILCKRITRGRQVTKAKLFTVKNAATTTGVTVGWGVIGSAVGFLFGGPAGASCGYFIGAGIGATGGTVKTICDDVTKETASTQFYVVLEFGEKLKKPTNGLKYANYMRLQSNTDGYSVFVGKSSEYKDKHGELKVDENKERLPVNQYEVDGDKAIDMQMIIESLKYHHPKVELDTEFPNYVASSMFVWHVWKVLEKL